MKQGKIKQEMDEIMLFFKKRNLSNDFISAKLGYGGSGTLVTGISRGTSKLMLTKLIGLKEQIEKETGTKNYEVKEETSPYITNGLEKKINDLQTELIAAQKEVIRLKDENISLSKDYHELREKFKLIESTLVNTEGQAYELSGERAKKAAS